jgi:hypothetical protein
MFTNESLRSTYKPRVLQSLNGLLTTLGQNIHTAHVGTKLMDVVNIPSNCAFEGRYIAKIIKLLGFEEELKVI